MKLKSSLLTISLFTAFSVASANAALVAYWNFNGLSISSASTPGSGGVPTSIPADMGAGSVGLNNWLGTVDDFAGTTINNSGAAPSGAAQFDRQWQHRRAIPRKWQLNHRFISHDGP